ncbi:MAG: hypothetical protein Athens071426_510 [Parcubacteria group bacterium Athens0714_26]|nr:MAG: hypothetical protein Athens071426_510 [Parcubacteria group bacterium Athens0714_26]
MRKKLGKKKNGSWNANDTDVKWPQQQEEPEEWTKEEKGSKAPDESKDLLETDELNEEIDNLSEDSY